MQIRNTRLLAPLLSALVLMLLVAVPGGRSVERVSAVVSAPKPGHYGTLAAPTSVDPKNLPPPPGQTPPPPAAGLPLLAPEQSSRLGAPELAATAAAMVEDPSAGPPNPPPAGAPPVGASFAGLGSTVNGVRFRPPDPMVAAGPNYLMETVNIAAAIYDKNGTVQSSFALSSFVGLPVGWGQSDPRVIYDALSGRFMVTYLGYINNASGSDFSKLYIAVSTTSNPLDPWKLYSLDFTNDFADYMSIAATTDKVTVSWNDFDIDGAPSGYLGVRTLVLQKSSLLAGTSAAYFVTNADTAYFTVRPAQTMSATPIQYMASDDFSSATSVHVWQITGTPAGADVAVIDAAQPAIGTLTSPPAAEASGSTHPISNGDNRILDAVWRGGHMWLSAAANCTWSGDAAARTCMRLIEVNTGTNAVLQDFNFGAAFTHYYFPALKTDGGGNLTVVFSRSSATMFAETRIVGRMVGDPVNTLSGSVPLKSGEVAYNPPLSSSEPPYRWGDYLGASVDPSDVSKVWVVGEYAKDDGWTQWGTWIGFARYDADADNVGDVVDNCPNVANPDQANTDAAPIATAGVIQLDVTIANSDGMGDACDPDDDNDLLTDAQEAGVGLAGASHALCPSASANTNPLLADSDGDGVRDGAECRLGSDPANIASKPVLAGTDGDRDGLSDAFEASIGSSAALPDSDGDGVSDGVEYKAYSTSPTATNTDGDSCPDGREIASVDANTVVNSIDLAIVAQNFLVPGKPNLDIDKNGAINSIDLAIVAQLFNGTPC